MKNQNKGITMIQIVITIIMMVLIAAFTILNSRDNILETKTAKIYNEIREVKQAVMQLQTIDEDAITVLAADKLSNLSSYPQLAYKYRPDKEYYLLDFKTKANILQELLDIRNVENNYIVNVKSLDDIEIFLVDGVDIGGEKYYTDDEIVEKYNDIFAGR